MPQFMLPGQVSDQQLRKSSSSTQDAQTGSRKNSAGGAPASILRSSAAQGDRPHSAKTVQLRDDGSALDEGIEAKGETDQALTSAADMAVAGQSTQNITPHELQGMSFYTL